MDGILTGEAIGAKRGVDACKWNRKREDADEDADWDGDAGEEPEYLELRPV